MPPDPIIPFSDLPPNTLFEVLTSPRAPFEPSPNVTAPAFE